MSHMTRITSAVVQDRSMGWAVTVSVYLYDPTLEVDEDELVYHSFTHNRELEDAWRSVQTLARIGLNEVSARRP